MPGRPTACSRATPPGFGSARCVFAGATNQRRRRTVTSSSEQMSRGDVKTFARSSEGGSSCGRRCREQQKKRWCKKGFALRVNYSTAAKRCIFSSLGRAPAAHNGCVSILPAGKHHPRSLRPASTEDMASISASSRAEFRYFPARLRPCCSSHKMRENRYEIVPIYGQTISTHLDVRQPHDPHSQFSSEAHGVEQNEGGVSKPLQHRGAHARDAQGVERVSGAGKIWGWEGAGRETAKTTIAVAFTEECIGRIFPSGRQRTNINRVNGENTA